MAVALPRMLHTGTDLSCRWDAGGDGHRRIIAKHHDLVLPALTTAVLV